MQKIVIDTNVIVSSIIQRSYPYRILYELFLDNKFRLCISDNLLEEYYEVLSRTKFARFQDFFARAEILLADIESKSEKFHPSMKLDLIADAPDNVILELADECNADFIITGNTTDFNFAMYKQTKIVTPKDYWEEHRPKL